VTDDSSDQPLEQGFLYVTPVYLHEGFTVQAQTILPTPWLIPALTAIQGVTATGEVASYVAAQMPLSSSFGRLSKRDMECLHFNRFCTDYLVATGKLPYTSATQRERPDFEVVNQVGDSTTLDCTQFVLRDQRQAHALFRLIVDRLSAKRERLTHLLGTVVTIWFRDDEQRPVLPPRSTDKPAADAIAEALAGYAFDPTATTVPGTELPDPMPNVGIENTDFGCGFFATPLRGSLPDSPTFASLGFEFVLAYQALHTRSSIKNELASMIAKKGDTPTSDVLVTVGGPARDGLCYPADEFFGAFCADEPLVVDAPSLHTVFLHFWSTGRIVQVLPTWEEVNVGIYGGRVPPHYTIRA
jgi:hypothetical protein